MEENIYHAICKISKKCRRYFYDNKYLNFDKMALERDIEEILKVSKELEKTFKTYKKEEK